MSQGELFAANTPNRKVIMIRGLTLWQPMAWAIAAGFKDVENRTWRPYRDVTHIAVHAGSTYHLPHAQQIEERLGIPVPQKSDLEFGAIICVAKISRSVEASDSPWFSGPVGWVLEDVTPLRQPIRCSGAMGMWKLRPQDLAELAGQLEWSGTVLRT